MSYQDRKFNSSGPRGDRRPPGGGDRGGRGRFDAPSGPLVPIGKVVCPCEKTVLVHLDDHNTLPMPSAILFAGEDKKLGRVDEVLGPLDDVYISINLERGIAASSFTKDQVIYATSDKTMPATRVTQPSTGGAKRPSGPRGAARPSVGFQRGGDRGGRGGFRGGSGDRGGDRGSFRGGDRGGRGGFRGGDRGSRGGFRGGRGGR